jgi:putative aldouronate transport system substrate-binding protein
VVRCFEAYGVDNYVEFIGSVNVEHMPWTPLYTWSNHLTGHTPEGYAWRQMGECKHKWLPQLVLAGDFDTAWRRYVEEYSRCNPDIFIQAAQDEVYRRLNDALSKGWSV